MDISHRFVHYCIGCLCTPRDLFRKHLSKRDLPLAQFSEWSLLEKPRGHQLCLLSFARAWIWHRPSLQYCESSERLEYQPLWDAPDDLSTVNLPVHPHWYVPFFASFHLLGTESATLCENKRHTHICPRTKASSAEPKACSAVSGMRPEATLEPSVRILTNRAHSIPLPNFSTMSHSPKSEQ